MDPHRNIFCVEHAIFYQVDCINLCSFIAHRNFLCFFKGKLVLIIFFMDPNPNCFSLFHRADPTPILASYCKSEERSRQGISLERDLPMMKMVLSEIFCTGAGCTFANCNGACTQFSSDCSSALCTDEARRADQ